MPHNEWRPDKGMKAPGVHVRQVVSLSQAQCDKLSELSAPLGPTQRLWIQQTLSESGGTHLYVRNHHSGQEWHVAVDGNAIELGPDPNDSTKPTHAALSDEVIDQRSAEDRRRDREAEELRIARRVIDRVGTPPPGEGTHPLQRHRDSMG